VIGGLLWVIHVGSPQLETVNRATMYVQKPHWLDYDPLALAVLVIGIGIIELLALRPATVSLIRRNVAQNQPDRDMTPRDPTGWLIANYPFERSHRFSGIEPNSVLRDYSR